MASKKTAPREPLSRDRIVEAAVALLDAEGEAGLTFRALTSMLQTGAGAIYWHVAHRDELLAAATEHVVGPAITVSAPTPRDTIRSLARSVFELVDEHPWLGPQLTRAPWSASTLSIFEHIGTQLQAMQVLASHQFSAASALVFYVVGVAAQNAANGATARTTGLTNRADLLATTAAQWSQLDAQRHPFLTQMATQLAEHDDLTEFLAGLDLILGGLPTVRASGQ